jgi:fructose-bisphosphate aldolase class II
MACNPRIKHVIPGIIRAADELDAVVAFELAKSEGNVDGGYTGQDPNTFFNTVINYVESCNFQKPFFIHGDHITTKSTEEEEIESSRRLIEAELEAGYTSFAIDASFNELPDNIRITTSLAKPIIEEGLGLEVEVGEIKSTGVEATLTTVEEATTFIRELAANGVHPDFLAINNGAKHGNYLDGEKIFIDLNRTKEIYDEVRPFGVVIAQHGITGTPLHLVGKFAEYGIRKGNVGTLWQNICHEELPPDLMKRMREWCEENKKDIKFATKKFKDEIDNIDRERVRRIEEKAQEEAMQLIRAFRANGTANLVLERLGS